MFLKLARFTYWMLMDLKYASNIYLVILVYQLFACGLHFFFFLLRMSVSHFVDCIFLLQNFFVYLVV